MAIPSYKEIVELLKKGLTLEAQEKIMELREAVLSEQEENHRLRKRIAELEDEVNRKRALRHEHGVFWGENDEVPFCPLCWEQSGKSIHLFGPNPAAQGQAVFWNCHTCGHSYLLEQGKTTRFY